MVFWSTCHKKFQKLPSENPKTLINPLLHWPLYKCPILFSSPPNYTPLRLFFLPSLHFFNLPTMASRLILKDIKTPLRFLLRNPASSAPSAQAIQNLLLPIPRQYPSGFLGQVCTGGRSQLSGVFNSSVDGGFRIEVRGKQELANYDDDNMEIDSDFEKECPDGFDSDDDDFFDTDEMEPQDDDDDEEEE